MVQYRYTYLTYRYLASDLADTQSVEKLEGSYWEKCFNCCCEGCTCIRLLERRSALLTKPLRKARGLGLKSTLQAISSFGTTLYTGTPIGSWVRELSVYLGFLVTLALLVNNVRSSAMEWKNTGLDIDSFKDRIMISELVFNSLAFFFTVFDVLFHASRHTCRCVACKETRLFCSECKHRMAGGRSAYGAMKDIAKDNLERVPLVAEHDTTAQCQDCFSCCPKNITLVMDTVRVGFLDLMFYPLLLMSVFTVLGETIVAGQVSTTTYVRFGLTTAYNLFGVYVLRAFVLGGTIYSVQKMRRKDLTKGSGFHTLFVLNCFGHMIVQVMMIISIGQRFFIEFKKENNHTNETYSNTTFHPSHQLYYMMASGYVVPVFGVAMFIFVNQFWTQQFPIKLFIDMLKTLKAPGKHLDGVKNVSKTVSEFERKWELSQLENNYQVWDGITFLKKLYFPFNSPKHASVCMFYFMFLAAFYFSAIYSGVEADIEHSGFPPWSIYYIAAASFTLVVNIYPCLVGFVTFVVLAVKLLAAAGSGVMAGQSSRRRYY